MKNKYLKSGAAALGIFIAAGSVTLAFNPAVHNLNDEQRDILREAGEFRLDGDFEAARNLVRGSGINFPMHKGMKFNHENPGAIKEAVENNDFTAFQEAVANAPFADQISEDQFEIRVEAHKLHQEGDFEGARALLESAGIQHPMKRFGGGMHFQNLSEDERELLEEARELRLDGNYEAAMEIMQQIRKSHQN